MITTGDINLEKYKDKEVLSYSDEMYRPNFHRGVLKGAILLEYLNVEDGIYRFATDTKGMKPFAIRTIDSPDDNIPKNVLSILPIKDQLYGVTMFLTGGKVTINIDELYVKYTGMISTQNVIKVEIDEEDIPLFMIQETEYMNAEVSFNLTKAVVSGYKKLKIKPECYNQYSIDKYVYNPMRQVSINLFAKDKYSGELVAYENNKATLLLSEETPDLFDENKIKYRHGIYRTTTFVKNSGRRIVRGTRLNYIGEEEINTIDTFDSMRESITVLEFKDTGERVLGTVLYGKLFIYYRDNGETKTLRLNSRSKLLFNKLKH